MARGAREGGGWLWQMVVHPYPFTPYYPPPPLDAYNKTQNRKNNPSTFTQVHVWSCCMQGGGQHLFFGATAQWLKNQWKISINLLEKSRVKIQQIDDFLNFRALCCFVFVFQL